MVACLRRIGRRVGESWLQWVRWGSGGTSACSMVFMSLGHARWKSLGKSINVLYNNHHALYVRHIEMLLPLRLRFDVPSGEYSVNNYICSASFLYDS